MPMTGSLCMRPAPTSSALSTFAACRFQRVLLEGNHRHARDLPYARWLRRLAVSVSFDDALARHGPFVREQRRGLSPRTSQRAPFAAPTLPQTHTTLSA